MGVRAALRALAAAVGVALLASASASNAASDALPRATADRRDDVTGPQVHALYVLPADGVDRALDTNGTIAASFANWQRWVRAQTFNNGIRLDTFGGELDVTFVRLGRTDAQLAARGASLWEALEDELRAERLVRPNKVYAAYYDGSNAAACGGAAWPPKVPGSVAALYLRSTFGPGTTCYEPERSRAGLQVMDLAILREVFNAMGYVPACAPNDTGDGHVSDSPRDLMYAGDEPWRPAVLDVGNDDYFHAHILGCREFAESTYLDRGFGANTVKLAVRVVGPGRVLSTPRGISCSKPCSATYERGMRLALRAVPAKGARFVGWSGSCRGTKACRVTLDRGRSVGARFRR
jgi:hypothetical protein